MYLPVEDLEETVAVLAVMVNLRKLTIDENNIHFLHQLDALAALTDVTDVVVGAGNPVMCAETESPPSLMCLLSRGILVMKRRLTALSMCR